MEPLHTAILGWYAEHARDLPWRRSDAGPWAVLVSEFMLQQTPVTRVLPVYEQWLARWPTPDDLAEAGPGEAVRAWGRLGYPRRALRLHSTAVAIAEQHAGQVPTDLASLRALPGVGDYTAAAVASFAHGHSHAVLDTNVRRVLARLVTGVEFPGPSTTRAERELATALLPDDGSAPRWSVAVMELGALVCTAARPRCEVCPVRTRCEWRAAGSPAYDGPPRRGQAWAGTDRQCRGRLMATLREADGPVDRERIEAAWGEPVQRARCLASLVEDGLVVAAPGQRYALP